MSYDDIIEVLAAALLEKAETVGCLEVLDGFSQRPDTEIEVSAPISEEMLALPLDKQAWPEECTPILKESSAATLGELVEYLNHCTATGKKLNVSEDAAAAMFPALITFCYDAADMNGKRFFWEYIHEDEVCKLMSEIDKCSMPEQAIVLSLLNTGVRRAELAGLTWSDFDFKECTVHVNKSLLVFRDFGYQHTATKESNDRYIDVAPEYMEFMQQYKEWWYTKKRLMGASWQRDMVKNKESKRESLMRLAGEEFVIIDDFGWPRNPDGYNALVKRVAKKAGLKDIHPHMFRHTFVSLLMSNPDIGVATVAAEAGHAQPSTTLMIYTQQYKKRRESIRNQLSRELYEK